MSATPERLRPGCLCHGEGEEKELARSPPWLGLLFLLEGLGFFCWGSFSARRGSSLPSTAAASLVPWGSGTDDSSLLGWQSAAKAPAKLRVPRASLLCCPCCWCFSTLFSSFAISPGTVPAPPVRAQLAVPLWLSQPRQSCCIRCYSTLLENSLLCGSSLISRKPTGSMGKGGPGLPRCEPPHPSDLLCSRRS